MTLSGGGGEPCIQPSLTGSVCSAEGNAGAVLWARTVVAAKPASDSAAAKRMTTGRAMRVSSGPDDRGRCILGRPRRRRIPANPAGSPPNAFVRATEYEATLVRLEVQAAFPLQRGADRLPRQAALLGDVAQREQHAFFHRLQAADIEMCVRIGEQRNEVDGALAHQVLHVALGGAGRSRERQVDVDEVLRQACQRAE